MIAVVASLVMPAACVRTADEGGVPRNDVPLDSLCDGDLAFRMGTSVESQIVMQFDSMRSQFSHVGIVINDHGTWKVVHAVPGEPVDGVEKVKSEPIDSFFLSTRALHGAIMRLKDCDAAKARLAARQAAYYASRGVPFDFKYNWRDTSRLYCTELVAVSFSHAGVNILNGCSRLDSVNSTGTIVLPGDIALRDSLTTIFQF